MKVEYFNIYVHVIITTLHREKLIQEKHRVRIEKYITGIISKHDCKLYAIYANPEHIHILISKSPKISEESLVETIQFQTEKFISNNKLCNYVFKLQNTCSAFSVSKSQVPKVCSYILNQKEHHKKTTFAKEYDDFIKFYQRTIK